jgi:hypothetical protein
VAGVYSKIARTAIAETSPHPRALPTDWMMAILSAALTKAKGLQR